jgi:hypothetical protein
MTPEPCYIEDIEPKYTGVPQIEEDEQEVEEQEQAEDDFWNMLLLVQLCEHVGLLDLG